jgi:fatty acid desaturase
MLRYKEDIRTLIYMGIAGGLVVLNWLQPEFNVWLFLWSCLMAVSMTTVVHNHNHIRIWESKWLNYATDYFLTLLYGFPVFAWIPTHNKNHHKFNNREGDYTITYRISERDNLLTLLSYPTISSFFQQKPIYDYLSTMWKRRKSRFFYSISQYVILAIYIGAALLLDWKKALLYVIIPQQVGLFAVLAFNYLQHVGADEESEWKHSRDMLSPVFNALVFNNGYHTVHHDHPGLHWSEAPAEHAKIADNLDPRLVEHSFFWFLIRQYILAPFIPSLRHKSLRLERMERERQQQQEAAIEGEVELAAAE